MRCSGATDFLDAARGAADFVLRDLRDADGRLLRTYKDGEARLNAYLEDHAFLLEALLTLYESTFEPRWFAAARELADTMIERFADDERGGFFETSSDHERLVARRKDPEDHPIPSGNASAAYGLLRLAALTGEHSLREPRRWACCACCTRSPRATRRRSPTCSRRSTSTSPPPARWRWPGTETAPLEAVVRAEFRPHIVVAGGEPDGVPLLEGRAEVDGRAAAYVCEHFACQRPVTEPEELASLLA